MVPQKKEWRVKADVPAPPVRPAEEPIRPVEASALAPESVGPVELESLPGFASSVPMTCDNELALVHGSEDDEQLVDYNFSPECMNLDINVIRMSMDGYVMSEEELAHLDFGPREAVF